MQSPFESPPRAGRGKYMFLSHPHEMLMGSYIHVSTLQVYKYEFRDGKSNRHDISYLDKGWRRSYASDLEVDH